MTGEEGSRSQDSGASWGWAAQKGQDNFSFGMKRKKKKMNMGTEQMDGTQRLCRGTHPYSISLGSRPPTAAHVSSTATVSDRTSPCLKLLGDFLTHLNETKSSRQCSRSSLAWPFLSPTVSTPTRPPSPPSFSPLGSWAYLESWELCSKQAQPSLLTLTHHSDLRSHVTSSEKPSAERPSHTRPGSLGSSPVYPHY